MFDWRHELSTTDPRYYKWTQWIFLQLLKAGKAYKKAAAVNWCPKDKTVLANEQVIDGRCERCGTTVEQRTLEQWFFRITEYCRPPAGESGRQVEDGLVGQHDDGAAELAGAVARGRRSNFRSRDRRTGGATERRMNGRSIRVFTTRPDTVYGATFMVLAPEHPLVDALTIAGSSGSRSTRTAARPRRKTWSPARWATRRRPASSPAVRAVNPATGKTIPVWIADYVLMEYGTGAIMAVPGHDERDFEFATKYDLPIVRVVARAGRSRPTRLLRERRYTDNEQGRLVNSGHPRRPDRRPRPRRRSPSGSSRRRRARASSSIACTTGASRASGTGDRPFRSSIATSTARCRCRRRISRCCCR